MEGNIQKGRRESRVEVGGERLWLASQVLRISQNHIQFHSQTERSFVLSENTITFVTS